ncbi:MAG: aldo/keto reductase [Lentisphaerae bacterium]|nr:aldo/keto reductase [Lentisphaerota bacterium]
MRYRPLGKTGLKVSALSMGCMRLVDDQPQNTRVVSKAIELGVNYFETTRFYCGGKCQHRTAPGLKEGKQGVIVSGKGAMAVDTTAFTFRQEIETQLEILELTHFKFYQVGWFSWGMIPHLLKEGGVLDAIRQAKSEGLIQHVGFTGHDAPENFIKCIETGLFDCITVPYNMVNRGYEPTIKRAGEMGVGVVAMCPVAGGMLAFESQRLKEELKMDVPTTEMALRFVLSNPDVSTACSGMSTMKQLKQNVRTAKEFDPEKDAAFEEMSEGLDRLRSALGEKFCTGCRYCMPCPKGVNIPRHMEIYRNLTCFGLDGWARDALKGLPADERAMTCDECGACIEKCPNDIQVPDLLKELQARLPVKKAKRLRKKA